MPASAAGLLDGAAPGGWSWSRLSDRVRLIALAARGLSIAAGVAAVAAFGRILSGRTFPGVSDESHAALEWFTLVGMAAGLFREQIALEAVAAEVRRTVGRIMRTINITPDLLTHEFSEDVSLRDVVMRSGSARWWMSLIFGWTTSAWRDVQRHVLGFLRDVDIPQDVRDVMFSWLLRLNARPADVLISAWWHHCRAVHDPVAPAHVERYGGHHGSRWRDIYP